VVLDPDAWFLTAGDGDLESGMPHVRIDNGRSSS
jgi:hypothetical protein